MEKDLSSLPFDELIRNLNNGYYLDTFEFGSIKSVEVPWPTFPEIKNKCSNAIADVQESLDIDPNKLDNKACKISEKKEIRCSRRVLETKAGSDLPLNHSSSVQEKKTFRKKSSIFPTIIKKNNGIDSNTVIKSVSASSATPVKKVSSVLGCPSNKDDEGKKLECSRRKLKQQYEEIESEKKRRRIQVIEYQKHPFADQKQTGKKAKKAQQIKKKSHIFVRGQKLDSRMFV